MIFLLRSKLYSQNPKTYNITVKGRGTLFKKMDNMNNRKKDVISFAHCAYNFFSICKKFKGSIKPYSEYTEEERKKVI